MNTCVRIRYSKDLWKASMVLILAKPNKQGHWKKGISDIL